MNKITTYFFSTKPVVLFFQIKVLLEYNTRNLQTIVDISSENNSNLLKLTLSLFLRLGYLEPILLGCQGHICLADLQSEFRNKQHSENKGKNVKKEYVTQTRLEVSDMDMCPSIGLGNVLKIIHAFGLK